MYQQQPNVYQEPMYQAEQQPMYRQEEIFNEADFEQAFTDAIAHAQHMEQSQDNTQMLHEDGTYTNDHSQEMGHDEPVAENIRIGADVIQYTEKQDRTADQNMSDADALARTAGELLNAVQHDTSEKFANSQFLNLMRQLRDREIEVQDDDFKATNKAALNSISTSTFDTAMQEDPLTATDPQLHTHEPNIFQFPNLNNVYKPEMDPQPSTEEPKVRRRFPGSWDYPSLSPAQSIFNHAQYMTEERAAEPASTLHPGGKFYPHPSPLHTDGDAEMSGAIATGITAEDFDGHEESSTLAHRFQSPSRPADADSNSYSS